MDTAKILTEEKAKALCERIEKGLALAIMLLLVPEKYIYFPAN